MRPLPAAVAFLVGLFVLGLCAGLFGLILAWGAHLLAVQPAAGALVALAGLCWLADTALVAAVAGPALLREKGT